MGRKRQYIAFYIYKTTNIVNGKIYVGQRCSEKLPEEDSDYLGSGSMFKSAVNKYGKESFRKEILEVCSIEQLDEREIYWIAVLNAKNNEIGYNLTIGGKSTKGYRFNDYSKEKMSNARKGKPSTFKGKKHTDEAKRKSSESKKGKPGKNRGIKMNKDFCDMVRSRSLKYHYVILTPTKGIALTDNLMQFSKENNLTARALDDSLRGFNRKGDRVLNHKGYVLLVKKKKGEVINEFEINKAIEKYNSTDKTKKKVPIEAIRRGAAKRRGVKLSNQVIENMRSRSIKYTYNVQLPTGEITTINNIKFFAKKHGLDNGNLMYTLRGYNSQGKTLTQHKGYKVLSKELIQKPAT